MGFKIRSSFILIIFFLSFGQEFGGASASSMLNNAQVSCNGTFADCFFGNDGYVGGEFLRHYYAGGRLLLQQGQKISYGSLQSPPVCNTAQYANCIVQTDNMNNRPCTAYNRCKRAG